MNDIAEKWKDQRDALARLLDNEMVSIGLGVFNVETDDPIQTLGKIIEWHISVSQYFKHEELVNAVKDLVAHRNDKAIPWIISDDLDRIEAAYNKLLKED